jgi:ribonuclease BN (tRNA processing enzyme)
VLLTHLHLDHIQGLLFFAPLFDPEAEVTVWGPPGGGRTLRERLARYLSNPLSPVEIRDLPASVRFEDVPPEPWGLGEFEVSSSLVAHRGPTLGYRIQADGQSVCYLPDHEPGLGVKLATAPMEWVSGMCLAHDASVLIHDGQYLDEEYAEHVGWGHSRLADALAFAARARAERTLLFHHDPGRDDAGLLALAAEAGDRWTADGNDGLVEVAREGEELEL